MDCREATGKIEAYLKDELKPREAFLLTRHLQSCPGCYEEADVRIMLEASESAGSDLYDFRGLLDRKIAKTRKTYRRKKLYSRTVLSLAALLVTVWILLVVFTVL